MKQSSEGMPQRRFPHGIGSSAVWQLDPARKLTLFVVDPSMPLYNLVIGDLRFFATAEQVTAFVERLEAAPADPPCRPTWTWVFETGFEKSVDGSPNKRWRLQEM